MNQPQFKRQSPHPEPEEVKVARAVSGLSQKEAGETVYSALRSWQAWESGDRLMPYGLFELFLLKTGQKDLQLRTKYV